eukprot:3313114-Rhodomonas_salina.3
MLISPFPVGKLAPDCTMLLIIILLVRVHQLHLVVACAQVDDETDPPEQRHETGRRNQRDFPSLQRVDRLHRVLALEATHVPARCHVQNHPALPRGAGAALPVRAAAEASVRARACVSVVFHLKDHVVGPREVLARVVPQHAPDKPAQRVHESEILRALPGVDFCRVVPAEVDHPVGAQHVRAVGGEEPHAPHARRHAQRHEADRVRHVERTHRTGPPLRRDDVCRGSFDSEVEVLGLTRVRVAQVDARDR